MNSIESNTARTSPGRQVRELRWSGAINSGAINSGATGSSDARTAQTSADREKRELRRFGLLMAAAFATLGGLSLWRGKPLAPYLLVLAAGFLIVDFVVPRLLAPVEKAWMRLAMLMSIVMTYLVLSILFFAVITPLGVVMRICGHDSLRLKKMKSSVSFWEPVDPQGPCGRPTKPY